MLINNANITGSLTVVGSSILSGSLTMSGSITTNSTITAQTLVVQTVTSSISYNSGSNIFGNLSSNTQQFTGSVLISGSSTALNVNSGAFFISSSSKVGIGTTNPIYPLDVQVANNDAHIRVKATTSGVGTGNLLLESNTGASTARVTGVYGVNQGVNVSGIGTYLDGNADGANMVFQTATGGTLTERMRITSGGNVLIGTTTDAGTGVIQANGSIYSNGYRLNDGSGGYVTWNMAVNGSRWSINYLARLSGYGSGTLTTDASGNITASSDRILKNVIKPVENALDKIMNFEPVYFKWNEKTDLDKENVYISTIAQSIEKDFPEAVGKMADGTLTVQDRAVMAILVKAIQELKAEIDELKNK